MSMRALTILQFFAVFGAYCLMTLVLPAMLLRKKLNRFRFFARFFIYQTVGSFFVINLVLVLGLLHISNRFTLSALTAAAFAAAYIRFHKKKPKLVLAELLQELGRLAGGQYGVRLFLRKRMESFKTALWRGIVFLWKSFWRHFPEFVLAACAVLVLFATYGINMLRNYGYCASDLVVHNYWINAMSQGKLFAAGVYPFGFHCVIYYIHTVFGIDTYVVLRVFSFVQTLFIHFTLLAFIRLCTKSKYTAYFGFGVYTATALFGNNTYVRYINALPQEFGMLFILPSIYFLFLFFEKRAAELCAAGGTGHREKIRGLWRRCLQKHSESTWCLVLFAMNFSLTLAVHFYDTMIAGLLCVGIAAGFCFRLFRRPYFGRIMLAGILSVIVAVLPMAVAFASGTPLQGSLGWGMSIISQSKPDRQAPDEEPLGPEDFTTLVTVSGSSIISGGGIVARGASITGGKVISQGDIVYNSRTIQGGQMVEDGRVEVDGAVVYTGRLLSIGNELPEDDSGLSGDTDTDEAVSDGTGAKDADERADSTPGLYERAQAFAGRMTSACEYTAWKHLFTSYGLQFSWLVPLSFLLALVLAAVYFALRRVEYAARLLSVFVGMCALGAMFLAPRMGWISLMDADRTSIYFVYVMMVLWCLCVDGVLCLLFGWMKKKTLLHAISFLLVPALAAALVCGAGIKDTYYMEPLQTNGAVTCLTNIIHDNEDGTWTICSANDEMRMGEDHGYHYELHNFLKQMEGQGGGRITIPTRKVYFFIEKVPIDYMSPYGNSGQRVSAKGALCRLPKTGGISMYCGMNRWIEMSRMYYWAKQFAKLYPNEMQVYYETDTFICYCVEQNMYSLYDFSIDYHYNRLDDETEQEE